MVQHQIQITGQLAACPGCGRQPKAYHCRGVDLWLLECAWCGTRTPKKHTMQEAVESWEASEVAHMVRHEKA